MMFTAGTLAIMYGLIFDVLIHFIDSYFVLTDCFSLCFYVFIYVYMDVSKYVLIVTLFAHSGLK